LLLNERRTGAIFPELPTLRGFDLLSYDGPHEPMKLSVISPTYNESGNVALLIAELEKILARTDYEILISDDDSPDRTWARVEEIGQRRRRDHLRECTAQCKLEVDENYEDSR